jgi:hypothetical protein
MQEANLGTFSNSTVYASLILSCMFLPSILIKWLKVSLFLSSTLNKSSRCPFLSFSSSDPR